MGYNTTKHNILVRAYSLQSFSVKKQAEKEAFWKMKTVQINIERKRERKRDWKGVKWSFVSPHKTFWILTLFFNLNINQIERMKFLFYLQNASKDTIIQLQNVSLGREKKVNVKMFISEMSWDLSEQNEKTNPTKILKKKSL